VTRKRTKAVPAPDAPITGVAAGSLGTAANLDDTQVLRTEDLQAAAPDWLDDDAPALPAEHDPIPSDELALLQTAQVATPDVPARAAAATPGAATAERAVPAAAVAEPVVAARPRARPRGQPRRPVAAAGTATSSWRRRSAPALAGVAALLVLLLIAGSGLFSQLDLGIGAGPTQPVASAKSPIQAAPSPKPKPREDKGGGHGKCDGHGHDCEGNED
jgi:hypothetical protein